MALASIRVLLFLILSTGYISQCVVAIINNPQNISFPSVIYFGDSIGDAGNNNNLNTVAKANHPPYGKDFMGGNATGRFSNGKVPPDMFAEELGIKELLPAYLDPNLQDQDLLTGVNFASGGSGFDPLLAKALNIFSLSDQLNLLKEYLSKLRVVAGEEKAATVLSNGLFLVITGSNDIANTYFSTPLRRYQYNVPAYTDFMLSFASRFIQDLYGLGARKIAIFGLPPIGCLPSQRTLKGGVERQCVEKYNEMVQLFNSKLIAEIKNFNSKYPTARIVYGDIYNLPLDLIYNPQKYGFNVGNLGCCGTGRIEVASTCRNACPNVGDYVFWDSFHFTEKAYRVLVQDFLSNNLNSFI